MQTNRVLQRQRTKEFLILHFNFQKCFGNNSRALV